MYDYNETFSKSAAQFADVAANANRLALENAEKVFGLHLAALENNVNATFAFANELIGVRDAEGLKAVWPKGIQVARTNAERSFGASEAIGALAKAQYEQASSQVKAEVAKAAKSASKSGK